MSSRNSLHQARNARGALVRRLRRDQKGMALVLVGAGLMAILSVSILTVDVGMLMTARGQAQNAADAGALAGAVAFIFDDFNDRSANGPAVQSALAAARSNQVMSQQVSVGPADVTFPAIDQIQVTVYRTAGRSNPVSTLVAQYFGMPTADISATATARAAPANAMTCVKPFTIPDKWIEKQTPPWDPDDTFDMYDNKGNLLANPDIYVPSTAESGYTGYDSYADKGLLITIKSAQGENIAPSFYYPWRIPGSNGADDYQWAIANCNTEVIHFGDDMDPENGNMTGPTTSGVEELIAKDPNAYWDTTNNRVVSTMHPSPRVGIIPVFDPEVYEAGKHTGQGASLQAANFIGLFIVGMQGNNVVGRITPVGGLIDGNAGPAPAGAFPKAMQLVK